MSLPVILWPLNKLLALALRQKYDAGSVLHVSFPFHIVHYTVILLRRQGVTADYVAVGGSRDWTLCDYHFQRWRKWMPLALTEFWFFWRVMRRYELVQFHFMQGISRSGWEWPILKSMGRKIIVYYSGCEARDWRRNMALHPSVNICEDCDYGRDLCSNALSVLRRRLSRKYADLEMVTTPDLLDFVPEAIHFPFFSPPADIIPKRRRDTWPTNGCLRIVHVTNHPGIEGTRMIADAVEALRIKGHAIEIRHIKGASYSEVLQELVDADLSIGKMKMGFYANAQIEALCCGVPTITHIRPDLRDQAYPVPGLIFSSLDELETMIEALLLQPGQLEAFRRMAEAAIRALHDNDELTRRLASIYREVCKGKRTGDLQAWSGLRPAASSSTWPITPIN
ncbi:hypothetical protein CU669_10930 [Paramagnetospirillum kuznetsovii]|uniref:Glycosyltransferase family 1 protein n=1 Tax=Paramagnetospirillum kuznetsovii TaxID=2053833 RepID=A0A364NXP3_9PROT|nr:glycosyltransferase family 1 protein [Paramagnetospirillum kuznetsovii]RAU21813.1 hypothetical protein CU669_10930 [Paramagnetospirillum kuznetsovii]